MWDDLLHFFNESERSYYVYFRLFHDNEEINEGV